MLHVQTGDRVLEIGFGGGGLLAALLASGAKEVIGADISEAMLARARLRFGREVGAGRLNVVQAAVDRLPLGSGRSTRHQRR
jgi:ubiquinone/menaquinone biosynthesis C-methylase UbiE